MTPSAAAIAAVAHATAHNSGAVSSPASPAYPAERAFGAAEGRRFSLPAGPGGGMGDPAAGNMSMNSFAMNPDPMGAYAGVAPLADTTIPKPVQSYSTPGGGGPAFLANVPSPGFYQAGPPQSPVDQFPPYGNPYAPLPYGPTGYTSFGAGQPQQTTSGSANPYMTACPFYPPSSDNATSYYDPYAVGNGGPYGSFGPGGVWYPHAAAPFYGTNPYASWTVGRAGYPSMPEMPSDASSESGFGASGYELDRSAKQSANKKNAPTQVGSQHKPIPHHVSQQPPSIQAQGAQLAASGIASFGPSVLVGGGGAGPRPASGDGVSESDERERDTGEVASE